MIESNPKILDAVISIICDLFGVEPSEINMETMLNSVSGWDSLQHVNLIIDIERHFRIHLSESQITSILGVRDAVEFVAVALQKQSGDA